MKKTLLLASIILLITARAGICEDAESDSEFSENPFEEYSEHYDDSSQEATERFFHYGRFYGIGFGGGMNGFHGNRQLLFLGGIPAFEAKITVFFDFLFAMQISYFFAKHYFPEDISSSTDVNMSGICLDFKYYINTKNLSAALTLANPYFIFGVGTYNSAIDYVNSGVKTKDSMIGINVGGGFEFPVVKKKFYIGIEGKYKYVFFPDMYTTDYQQYDIPDLTGGMYSFTGSVMFYW